MKYRKLGIAWSAAWCAVCLLVVVLWVRSYSIWDEVSGEAFNNTWILVRSLQGQLTVSGGYDAISPLVPFTWASYDNFRVENGNVAADYGVGTNSSGTIMSAIEPERFGITMYVRGGRVLMPHWFPSALFLGLAAVPWFRWRFSLRTLLIAATLIAVVMGAAVYLSRN